jgi:glycosyltransferase involved in cell wall biosynthesis
MTPTLKNNIEVAIFVSVYNHENYIRQCLDSIINQEVDFQIRLFIGDDCSSDASRDICEEFCQKYPGLISYESSSISKGANENYRHTLQRCKNSGAKYIAMIDGDDFWCDVHKLQRQRDFLELNKLVSGVCHNVYQLSTNGKRTIRYKSMPNIINAKDYIYPYSRFHTSSLMFRSESAKWHDWMSEIRNYDIAFFSTLLTSGDIGVIHSCMSVYRIHSEGISSSSQYRETYHEDRMSLWWRLWRIEKHFYLLAPTLKVIKYHRKELGKPNWFLNFAILIVEKIKHYFNR